MFVKLCQFAAGDHSEIRIDITTGAFTPVSPGVSKQALYRFGDQDTHLTRFAPGATAEHHIHVGGEEVFVIEGTWQDDRGTYPAGTGCAFPTAATIPRTAPRARCCSSNAAIYRRLSRRVDRAAGARYP